MPANLYVINTCRLTPILPALYYLNVYILMKESLPCQD